MKRSQIALLSLGGTVLGSMIILAAITRVGLSQSAPDSVRSEESITTETDLTGFRRIDVGGSWRLQITRGDDWSIQVEHPEGVEIDARLDGDRLELSHHEPGRLGWFGNSDGRRIRATIVMPELVELDLAGASRTEISGVSGEQLEIDVAGAVNLSGGDGSYDALELSVAGASRVDLRELLVTDADVDMAGASRVTLNMNGGELTGSMAGAGSLEYYGAISSDGVTIAGVGRVRAAN